MLVSLITMCSSSTFSTIKHSCPMRIMRKLGLLQSEEKKVMVDSNLPVPRSHSTGAMLTAVASGGRIKEKVPKLK